MMSWVRLENALTFAAHLSSAELIFLFAFSLHHLPAFVLFFFSFFSARGRKLFFPRARPWENRMVAVLLFTEMVLNV